MTRQETGEGASEGESADERIIGVYVDTMAVDCGSADKTVYLINATGAVKLTLRLAETPSRVEAFDTFGASAPSVSLEKGVQDAAVPPSGYLKVSFSCSH